MGPTDDAIPLTEATLCILLSLAGGPRHGYAIMQDVRALSAGRIELGTGTLYGALRRLLDAGWISRADQPGQPESGRPTKVYRLSESGNLVLRAELDRLQSLLEVARRRAGQEGAA